MDMSIGAIFKMDMRSGMIQPVLNSPYESMTIPDTSRTKAQEQWAIKPIIHRMLA